jgi:hypothetical protein
VRRDNHRATSAAGKTANSPTNVPSWTVSIVPHPFEEQ